MIREKMFPDNHAIAGPTALAYNIEVTDFYEQDTSKPHVRTEFANKITDIGFEWKKTSDSSWTKISLKNNAHTYFYSCDGDVFTANSYVWYGRSISYNYVQKMEKTISGKKYYFQQYIVNKTGYERHPMYPFPIRVIITELTPNTSYDIRSYYVHNTNGTIYYNVQTINTLPNERTLTYSNITLTNNATTALQNGSLLQTTVDNFTNLMTDITVEAQKYFKWFYNYNDVTITLKIDYSKTGEGAVSSGNTIRFNLYYKTFSTNENITRSTLVHETGHCLTHDKSDGTKKPSIIKFMEFMTNSPYANWKWTGGHVYPIISSQYFSPMDDALNFSGFNLMIR